MGTLMTVTEGSKRGIFSAEQIAQVCHEANREITRMIGDVPVQAPWTEITDDMRVSTISGVKWALENPLATSAERHWHWVKTKQQQGWVHGSERDEAKKTHPAMVVWTDLGESVKRKDDLFGAIVRALGPRVQIGRAHV